MDQQHLLVLAEYNVWATLRLSESLKQVTEQDLNRDIGLFFKSILGTLNHLLVGEHYVWYPRFKDGISPVRSLSEIIEPDAQNCINQLIDKSYFWIDFIRELKQERLLGNLDYQRANGEALNLPFIATLIHVFNHGTHHRGQITAAMTMMGYSCSELDLVNMLVEQKKS